MLRALLFDLDGTLTDSAPIITRTIAATMRELAGEDRPAEEYIRFVGPPLMSTFTTLGVPKDDIERYIDDYRARYAQMCKETQVFAGVVELLKEVRDAGYATALATSKVQEVAQRICQDLGLSQYLDVIRGASNEKVHQSKAYVVAAALDDLHRRGVIDAGAGSAVEAQDVPQLLAGESVREDVLMVGDRIFDILGAGAHGIRTVLVTWGDRWPEEEAQAWKVVHTPQQLLDLVMGDR
ncbi:HAD hydrolase-like protein [Trueperella sp. LYQ143]|uniref:HAD hydrolase-like protein n=1 Tax=unclassified Trueperella TaxID=2630174 RepID=UPI0039834A64